MCEKLDMDQSRNIPADMNAYAAASSARRCAGFHSFAKVIRKFEANRMKTKTLSCSFSVCFETKKIFQNFIIISYATTLP